MEVEVTWSDLIRGRAGSAMACPVALALQRATNARISVATGSQLRCFSDGTLTSWATPPDVATRIQALDEFRYVATFSFSLDEGLRTQLPG